MSILDTAKELLRKGIALNDSELIEMANSLIEADTAAETAVQSDITQVVEQPAPPERVATDDFSMAGRQVKEGPTPINKVDRGENLFTDDKSEHMDIETPSFTPSQRRDKPRKTEQKCVDCNKTVEVADIHRRDFFVCDDCLSNKRR
jgi:hypothetical protein